MFLSSLLPIILLVASSPSLAKEDDQSTGKHLSCISPEDENCHYNYKATRIITKESEVPDQRPPLSERLYISEKIEQVIDNVSRSIRDETLRQIFINCLPNTLDTTVYFHLNRSTSPSGTPYTYIITGDIKAMWLRDSTYQIDPYVSLALEDPALIDLILGTINTQAEMILLYPYGNAFLPLRHWNASFEVEGNPWALNDTVNPVYDPEEVFEAKYELDSLASFLYLSHHFYRETGNYEFVSNPNFTQALRVVHDTIRAMQTGTLDVLGVEPYTFTRPTRSQSETQNLYGKGNPVRRCGLVRSFFRPSDDATIFPYLIPSNAMAVVGLMGVARLLNETGGYPELALNLTRLAEDIDFAIRTYGIVQHPQFGRVFAYEVDCYGSHVFMDDANFPSLLSLPKIGYVDRNDGIYLNTRRYILSSQWNPYYAEGIYPGVGSPHTGLQRTWHLSLIMQGLTTDNEVEMRWVLSRIRNSTGGTGLMHESFDVNNPSDYSRAWFAWANTVFGDFILYLYNNYPHILEM